MSQDSPHTPGSRLPNDPTGFPSPAQVWRERVLSFDDLFLYPETIYVVRMRGHAMRGAGICDQDLLFVDRAMPIAHGCIILAQVNTRFLVRRILLHERRTVLSAAHPGIPLLTIESGQDITIWGVVLYVLHAVHPWSKRRIGKKTTEEQHNDQDHLS